MVFEYGTKKVVSSNELTGYRTKRVVFNADGTRCFLVPSAFYLFE